MLYPPQLAGFEAPAVAWEARALPARVRGYRREWLDQATPSGEPERIRVPWWRLVRELRTLEARGEVRGGRFVGRSRVVSG